MKRAPLLVVAAMFMLINADPANAFRLGSFDAGLNLSVSSRYDDNVYITNGNEVDDFYFVISPGFYINNSQNMNNELKLTYNADIYRYIDTHAANDVEDHFVSGLIHLNKNGRVWLRVGDDFARKHEDRQHQFVTTGNIRKMYTNNLEAEVGIRFSEKFEVAFAYEMLYVDFTDSANAYRDRTENSGSLTAFYRMMPKTRLLVQGIYKNIYHTDDTLAVTPTLNSDEVWAMAGVTWDITEKSTGIVKVGYEWKDMQHPAVNDYGTPIYIVEIQHDFTPKTSVALTGTRRAMETDDPNTSYYTTTTGEMRVALHPVRKLLVRPFVRYVHDRYNGATVMNGDRDRRLENTFHYGIDLGYEVNDWLDVRAGYEFSKRSSTLPAYDYSKNLVSLTLSGSI